MRKFLLMLIVPMLALSGCWGGDEGDAKKGVSSSGPDGKTTSYEATEAPAGTPTFVGKLSEYPSWSHFLVADAYKIIDKRQGWQGEYERKHGVDLVLTSVDYDTCITEYGTGVIDFTMLTNIDTLSPAIRRPTVAVLPTSTSNGADALVVIGINDIASLKGVITRGLEDSVAQYSFERNLELKNLPLADYPFQQQDPGAAAQAMMQGQDGYNAIQVWNPFVLTVLQKRKGSTVLFDSTTIPEEIVDMVVFGKDALDKDKGRAAAQCVVDAYYATCKVYGPAMGDSLLSQSDAETVADDLSASEAKAVVALSKLAGFDSLDATSMVRAVRMTRFYYTPDKGIALFEGNKFQTQTMGVDGPVARFCKRNITDFTDPPQIGFGSGQMNFDTSFMKASK